ncbi:hypothetical protein [Terrisporobacter petrolearius]
MNNIKEIFMNTDYSYSNKKILLSKVVAEYIESIYILKSKREIVDEKI